jgi:hypothetical protein
MYSRFYKLTPKRPMVIRKGYDVKKCFLWTERKECYGPMCYWAQIGKCKFKSNKNVLDPRVKDIGKAK